jgi:hypothetical protein
MSKSNSPRASDVRAERQKFLWGGRIPIGHITVIAGMPDIGKSTLGYHIGAAVNEPTIYVSTEEDRKTLWKPRILAAGCDQSKSFHHPEIKFGKGREDELAELVEEYGAKLVIVDPLANHLQGASIHRDEQVRNVLEPYMALMGELKFAIIFELHVLRDVAKNAHPLKAIPAGVVSSAKAVYLFGEDPGIAADPDVRILACADKFNFGKKPNSLLFEFQTVRVKVYDEETKGHPSDEYTRFLNRGEVKIPARALLIKMRPEDKERKQDRVVHALLQALRDGPRPVPELQKLVAGLDPPVSWRTARRVADEMGIIKEKDEKDKRSLTWALPQQVFDELQEAGTDPVDIIEIDIPDTVPEEWEEGSGR